MIKKVHDKISNIYKEYDNLIDLKSESFLNHNYFHSHITFSRNHLIGSEILINLIKKKYPKKKYFHFIQRAILFYLRNIYHFIHWLIYFIYAKLLLKGIKYDECYKNKIFIQTFLNSNSVDRRGNLTDNFFAELYNYLNSKSQGYIIIANIFEKITNFKKRIKLLKNFKKSKKQILTEFDCLSFVDIVKILVFIISFPLVTLSRKFTLKSRSYLDRLFYYDYINSISNASFLTYVQFLFAKKLKKLIKQKKTKIISWNENQLIHRNFLRGIKNENITVYGCQYFLKYPSCRWMYFRDKDKKYNVIPDKILVCGKEYLPEKSKLNYSIGSPFRYRNVYSSIKPKENSKLILVLLPYEQIEAFKIIDFLKKSKLSENYVLHFKIHPSFSDRYEEYKKKFLEKWIILKKNYDFSDYNVIITKSSGSIIEYIAQGCTLIILTDNEPLELNPLTNTIGYEINYDYVNNPHEIVSVIKKMINKRKSNFIVYQNNVNTFKLKYFSKITEKSLINDFDI